jgi:hypothetical protein
VAGIGYLVIGGNRKLEDHMRTMIADAPEMSGVIARGFRGTYPDIDCNPCSAQFGMPLPRHFRIGIFHR